MALKHNRDMRNTGQKPGSLRVLSSRGETHKEVGEDRGSRSTGLTPFLDKFLNNYPSITIEPADYHEHLPIGVESPQL